MGFYSFDLGGWHIISLNSNVTMRAGSEEELWLRADLAASSSQCTIAIWHHPLFSSGNTEAFSVVTNGVLKLTLGPGTYTWQFIPIDGQTFTDSGSGVCHR